MTVKKAKKVIELCTDVYKRGFESDEKTYINKDYVLSILDMVKDCDSELQTKYH